MISDSRADADQSHPACAALALRILAVVAPRYEGRLAQLVRAPALQAGGRRFESCTAHHFPHVRITFLEPDVDSASIVRRRLTPCILGYNPVGRMTRVQKTTATASRRIRSVVAPVAFALCSVLASAQQPQVVLNRDSSTIALEAYAPNIIRVTLSLLKDSALAPPGFGFVATPSADGWTRQPERSSRYLPLVAPGGDDCKKPPGPSLAHTGRHRKILQWLSPTRPHHHQHARRQECFSI